MRRRAVSVIVFSAMLAVLLVAATGSAQAATFVTTQNLGRRQVAHSAGSAFWLSSSQVQYGDTNGNFLTDSERGRCAVKRERRCAHWSSWLRWRSASAPAAACRPPQRAAAASR